VMPFVLGAKGNEWAWRNRRWRDLAHFRRVQRNWAIAGAIFWGCAIVFYGGSLVFMFWFFDRAQPYMAAAQQLAMSQIAARELGTPIIPGFDWNAMLDARDGDHAHISFPARGPKASATVYADETRGGFGRWTVDRLQLVIVGRDGRIDILPRRP